MLVAAAICPHPPLLVPGLAAGASEELDDLRVACDAAVALLLGSSPSLVVVVGGAESLGPATGPVAIPGRSGRPTPSLALALGQWLLDRAEGAVVAPVLLFGVPADTAPARCAAIGEALAGRAARVALLVMGDGSARRSAKGPGGLSPEAAAYDDRLEAALRAGDPVALTALDADQGARVLAAGRAPVQVLAGAARGESWQADLTWSGAPYGVTYLVATWQPSRMTTQTQPATMTRSRPRP